jgi:PadR family transcriptional regulator PadR
LLLLQGSIFFSSAAPLLAAFAQIIDAHRNPMCVHLLGEEKPMNLKGSLPLLILHVLSERPKHGYQIAQEIKQQSSNVLAFREGTLYPALHGLEKQGAIAAYTQEVNGHTRRYYQLTDTGKAMLSREMDDWKRLSSAINTVLGVQGAS